MKKKSSKTTTAEKTLKVSSLRPLSKVQLETIIGGPETSRGTETSVGR